MTIFGLPFRACRSGCADRRFASDEFVEAVEAAIVIRGEVPVARLASGDQLHCRRCMSRQFAKDRGFATVVGEVGLEGLPRFSVHVTGMAQSCANCGLSQLLPTTEGLPDLRRALVETFRAAGIRTGFR
ncbi:MAG TPA: hypothetical protein VFL95_00305 [Gemmatimonadales bacterium]|nr:hypothetical protein [Gemmatimonadales bacterium]